MTYTLSAPSNSGYTAEFDTLNEVRAKAADLLDVTPASLVEVEGGDDDTIYCYASQADADADQDGAYAVKYSTAGARYYAVFVDEGPAAGRLKEHFATQAEAEKRAKKATDGRYIVYAIKSDYSDEEVARGAGREKEESA